MNKILGTSVEICSDLWKCWHLLSKGKFWSSPNLAGIGWSVCQCVYICMQFPSIAFWYPGYYITSLCQPCWPNIAKSGSPRFILVVFKRLVNWRSLRNPPYPTWGRAMRAYHVVIPDSCRLSLIYRSMPFHCFTSELQNGLDSLVPFLLKKCSSCTCFDHFSIWKLPVALSKSNFGRPNAKTNGSESLTWRFAACLCNLW